MEEETVHIDLERIEDKIECFEANDLQILEQKINQKIDINKALLLEVANIHYQVPCIQKNDQPYYTALVHFKAKRA